MFSGLDKKEISEVRSQYLIDIAKASVPSSLPHLVFFVLVYMSSDLHIKRPSFTLYMGMSILVLVFTRLFSSYLLIKNSKRKLIEYVQYFSIATLGLYWGIMHVVVFNTYSEVNASEYVILVMVVAGIGAAGVESIKYNYKLALVFSFLLIVPGAVDLVLNDLANYRYLGFIYFIFFVFLASMARINHINYWKRVTSVKLLEKRNKENEVMQKQISHASKLASLGELSAGVAHEINNPLMIIQGNLEICDEFLIKNKISNEESGSFIKNMRGSIKRIAEIVESLRTYARPDRDNQTVFRVDPLIENSISLVSTMIRDANISVLLNKDYENDRVLGVPGKLQQVIINLVSNARDALEDSKNPEITISLYNDCDNVYVEVKDNGEGIKKENLDKIFDSFYSTKEVGKGTGLGLSISYSIVKSMNGSIDVESIRGVGSKFLVRLPSVK